MAAIQIPERGRQRVTVRAEQSQVRLDAVVGVPIDVFNIERNAVGDWVASAPPALLAALTEFLNEVAPHMRGHLQATARVDVPRLLTRQPSRDVGSVLELHLTLVRAEPRVQVLDDARTDGASLTLSPGPSHDEKADLQMNPHEVCLFGPCHYLFLLRYWRRQHGRHKYMRPRMSWANRHHLHMGPPPFYEEAAPTAGAGWSPCSSNSFYTVSDPESRRRRRRAAGSPRWAVPRTWTSWRWLRPRPASCPWTS